jgi:hypothetical protein
LEKKKECTYFHPISSLGENVVGYLNYGLFIRLFVVNHLGKELEADLQLTLKFAIGFLNFVCSRGDLPRNEQFVQRDAVMHKGPLFLFLLLQKSSSDLRNISASIISYWFQNKLEKVVVGQPTI